MGKAKFLPPRNFCANTVPTHGQRSPIYVGSHRRRLDILPFMGDKYLPEVTPGLLPPADCACAGLPQMLAIIISSLIRIQRLASCLNTTPARTLQGFHPRLPASRAACAFGFSPFVRRRLRTASRSATHGAQKELPMSNKVPSTRVPAHPRRRFSWCGSMRTSKHTLAM